MGAERRLRAAAAVHHPPATWQPGSHTFRTNACTPRLALLRWQCTFAFALSHQWLVLVRRRGQARQLAILISAQRQSVGTQRRQRLRVDAPQMVVVMVVAQPLDSG